MSSVPVRLRVYSGPPFRKKLATMPVWRTGPTGYNVIIITGRPVRHGTRVLRRYRTTPPKKCFCAWEEAGCKESLPLV